MRGAKGAEVDCKVCKELFKIVSSKNSKQRAEGHQRKNDRK